MFTNFHRTMRNCIPEDITLRRKQSPIRASVCSLRNYVTGCITVRQKCNVKSCKRFILLFVLYDLMWEGDCRNNAGCLKINRDQFQRHEYSQTVITVSTAVERGGPVHCHCTSGSRVTRPDPGPSHDASVSTDWLKQSKPVSAGYHRTPYAEAVQLEDRTLF